MSEGHYIALSGGVGGAKLALGLAAVLPAEALTIVVNTGDDFSHLGLEISPDLDTVLYTLAGVANAGSGWGRDGESWNFMSTLKKLDGETWFQIGDKDLALHIERTRRLATGETLSEVTGALSRAFDVQRAIVPMSDDPVRTMVTTAQCELTFQHYFVREKCQPAVTGFRFSGIDKAVPSPGFLKALRHPDLKAIIICPSNPFVSVDPIMAIPGVRDLLRSQDVPVIAVSPIIKGLAVKGPTAKMMKELGVPSTSLEIAGHYLGVADALMIDTQDSDIAADIEAIGMSVQICDTMMITTDDKRRVAEHVLTFVDQLSCAGGHR